jgi:DNA-binding XRE family transcriptional regulator
MSSSEFHHYTRDEFLAEFYPDPADKAAIAAGMERLRAEQRAFRLAEMRRRLGITQAQVADRMGITQGRVSAIEHAKPGRGVEVGERLEVLDTESGNGSGAVNLPSRQKRKRRRVPDRTGLRKRSVCDSKV